MAIILTKPLFSFSLFLVPTLFTITGGVFAEQFAETKVRTQPDKRSHLHFYFHDILSGKNPTAVRVARPKNAFGAIAIMDDPLTEGPEPGSKVVGRAQGMYALASQRDSGLLMVLNFVFLEGRFNGCALSILGRNRVFDPVREMPVVGGSGVFRFARGYALARTIRYDPKTGDAVVEYDVFVNHV